MSDLNIPENAVAAYDTMQNQLGQDADEITDLEFFQWVKTVKSVTEQITCMAENDVFLLTIPATYSGVLSSDVSDSIRDHVVSKTIFAEMVKAFRKSWQDECDQWMVDNGGEL